MALFQAGDTVPSGTVTLTVTVPDDVWFKRALLQALFLLASPDNWDNTQGIVDTEACASLSVTMISSMTWI